MPSLPSNPATAAAPLAGNSTSEARCYFDDIPDELILEMLTFLAEPAVIDNRLTLLRVNRRFRRLVVDAAVWPCDALTPAWIQASYSARSDVRELYRIMLCLREVLLLVHAAWPDPNAPPPPLRLPVDLGEEDAALLAHAEAIGFWHRSQSLGQVIGNAKFARVETKETFATLWTAIAGPNVACIEIVEPCVDARPLSLEHLPGVVDFRSEHVPGGSDEFYALAFRAGLQRLYVFDVRLPLTDELGVLPAAYTEAVSTLQWLNIRQAFPIRPANFPHLVGLNVCVPRPSYLGWERRADLPPSLREVTFWVIAEGDFRWCLEFWEENPQIEVLMVIGMADAHETTVFASATLPRPGPDGTLSQRAVVVPNFEGRGFELRLQLEALRLHNGEDESVGDTDDDDAPKTQRNKICYRMKRL